MGVIKKSTKEKEYSLAKKFIIVFVILIWIIGLLFILSKTNNYSHKTINKLSLPDTLHVIEDLHSNPNLDAFIYEKYPNYQILNYNYVNSDYSAWDGVHNFYEFTLIKK